MYYVYVIQNIDDNADFYLGYTEDLKQRLASHNAGRNRATKNKRWQVIYYEAYVSLSAAREREYRLKHDGRARRYLMLRIKSSIE